MPLLKRKPVIYQPLPSLSTILQPLASSSKDTPNESTPPPPLAPGNSNGSSKSKKSKKVETESEIGEDDKSWVPPDCEDDHDQLRLLSRVFEAGFTNGAVTKGKKAGTWIVNGSVNIHPQTSESENGDRNGDGIKEEVDTEEAMANGAGEMLPPPAPVASESWKITDREVYYIPETGEIFTEYE